MMLCMSDEDAPNESFEERIRAFARELGHSAERMAKDIDDIAESIGIDPDRAREWADTASRWLRGQVEGLGDDFASRGGPWSQPPTGPWSKAPQDEQRPRVTKADDPLSSAGPHPLDVPTDEQGAALAALDSGRWTVEPGSRMLTGHGDGNGPNDALGLVRELHARDWIDGEGQVTLVGRRALSRWLDGAPHR